MRSVCAVLLLIACGGGKGGDATGAAAAAQDSIELTCRQAFECRAEFPSELGSFEALFGSSEAECIAKLTADLDPAAIQDSVDDGRIVFDVTDARACLAARDNITCGQLWGTEPFQAPPACETTFVGTVAAGGACTIDLDCAGGGSCDQQVCGGANATIDQLPPADQAALCEDFLDGFCTVPDNQALCDDPCINTGCTPAAEGGSLGRQCTGVTPDEVLDCVDPATCSGGPGCIIETLIAQCQ